MNLKAFCCNPIPKIAETCNFLRIIDLAERGGFEPPEVLPSTVFETATINRSAISPVPSPGTSGD
jgi:hypothetical protein